MDSFPSCCSSSQLLERKISCQVKTNNRGQEAAGRSLSVCLLIILSSFPSISRGICRILDRQSLATRGYFLQSKQEVHLSCKVQHHHSFASEDSQTSGGGAVTLVLMSEVYPWLSPCVFTDATRLQCSFWSHLRIFLDTQGSLIAPILGHQETTMLTWKICSQNCLKIIDVENTTCRYKQKLLEAQKKQPDYMPTFLPPFHLIGPSFTFAFIPFQAGGGKFPPLINGNTESISHFYPGFPPRKIE